MASTHGITIDRARHEVWPWLAQVGQGRAGFYSYAWLENLIGCDIHNKYFIDPALQDLRVGDEIRLHPKAPPLRVSGLLPGRLLKTLKRLVEASSRPVRLGLIPNISNVGQ